MKYEDIINKEGVESSAEEDMQAYMSSVPVLSLDSIYSILQPLDDKSKLWLINKLSADLDNNDEVRDFARRICSEEEFNRLDAEGFLDSPVLPEEPANAEELLKEVTDFHNSGYLSAEDTQKWFEEFAS